MKVERYLEDDMRQAMAKVRETLGNDAVILSTRRVGGQTEITAALDYDPTKSKVQIESLVKESANESNSELNQEEVKSASPLNEIQEELGQLRKLFEGELTQLAWRDMSKTQPNRFALLSRLEVAGVNRGIGSKIVDRVLPCDDLELGWRRVLRMLSRAIKISDQKVLETGGIIAMIGPTGVGKTTTAAKLAAQFALLHGRNQVALVTTDNYRVGGQEQLMSFGSILGVPVQVATNPEEMQKTLSSFSERKLIIIDTAGMSQRDMSLEEQFESLDIEGVTIDPYLVLSSTVQESIISETIKAFARFKPVASIITRTDECSNLGGVLSGLIVDKLPVAFVGNGQRVPEDLLPAQADNFIADIVSTYDDSRKRLPEKKIVNSLEIVKNV